MEHYDIGILGVWSGCNYGSIATYYALNQVLDSMGKSVLMIDKPILSAKDAEAGKTHARRFGIEHYHISERYHLSEMGRLNALCDTFLIGSDQVWNYGISRNFGKAFYLNFAAEEKKKLAYAVSFGHAIDFAPPEERAEISKLMRRFDGISVREEDGVRLCRDDYGINAVRTLDPVFLADPAVYEPLIQKSAFQEPEPFLAAYILDPTPEKREAILFLAQKLGGLKPVILLDGFPWKFQQNRQLMNLPGCVENAGIEEWLYCLSHAEYVLTDSCHGASFSIIFRKNFIPIANRRRGISRFQSLTRLFHLKKRLVFDPTQITHGDAFPGPVDYGAIEPILKEEKARCYAWLREHLEEKKLPEAELEKRNLIHPPLTIQPLPGQFDPDDKEGNAMPVGANQEAKNKAPKLHPDIERCRMIAALLRDYDIRHVVCSSGTRHVELVRFLEKNDCFQLHRVLDERSAAFFALGIAAKTRRPVAVCCTSGTASSNYLSAASEAFYQHIPLIFVTADRYPNLLNQREDQMVPQENMYGSVCLKSVSLPTGDSSVAMATARRRICEAILAAASGTPGPVHINNPTAFFNRKPLPDEAYDLASAHYNRIRRYQFTPNRSGWNEVVQKLSGSKVLLLYGQAPRLDEEAQKALEDFSKRFNCVIATEHLSNAHGGKCVNVYNLVKNKDLPLKELHPDIVITLYGGMVSGTGNFTQNTGSFYHWEIAPGGEIADPFRRITRVFACTPTQFFKRASLMAGDVAASSSYYEAWKRFEAPDDPIPETYGQKYAISQVIPRIPAGALLHLSNSNTVRMASSYALDKDVEVFCNRGTNGIDGSASAFMGQAAISDNLCFLLIGDLSFFYDMNSLWNKELKGNLRIMLLNNHGTSLLRHHASETITHEHSASAEGWVKSLGFTYLSSHSREEFDANIGRFVSREDTPLFFEVFC